MVSHGLFHRQNDRESGKATIRFPKKKSTPKGALSVRFKQSDVLRVQKIEAVSEFLVLGSYARRETMSKILILLLLADSTTAGYSGIAQWTGRSHLTTTPTGKAGVACEYRVNGGKAFWVDFVGNTAPQP